MVLSVRRRVGEGGKVEMTAGQSDEMETLLDDEDMAYGQGQRARRRRRGR